MFGRAEHPAFIARRVVPVTKMQEARIRGTVTKMQEK
jgi:hypothetical protein